MSDSNTVVRFTGGIGGAAKRSEFQPLPFLKGADTMTIKELEDHIVFCTKGMTDEEKATTEVVMEYPDTRTLVLKEVESDKDGLYLISEYE